MPSRTARKSAAPRQKRKHAISLRPLKLPAALLRTGVLLSVASALLGGTR